MIELDGQDLRREPFQGDAGEPARDFNRRKPGKAATGRSTRPKRPLANSATTAIPWRSQLSIIAWNPIGIVPRPNSLLVRDGATLRTSTPLSKICTMLAGWPASLSSAQPLIRTNDPLTSRRSRAPYWPSRKATHGATYLDDGLVEMFFQIAFQERGATGGYQIMPDRRN
jgi:hypothetical protein